jgi:microcystin-dependent protein
LPASLGAGFSTATAGASGTAGSKWRVLLSNTPGSFSCNRLNGDSADGLGSAVGTVSIFVGNDAPFIGEIRMMSFGFAPRFWAPCNGQLLLISTNQALFSLLGTTFGGNGTTTFGLPDLRGRVPIHDGAGHTLGERGGEQAHTLSVGELPGHAHVLNGTNEAANTASPGANLPAQATAQIYNGAVAPLTTLHGSSVTNAGGSQAHLNMQPFLTVSFCIAISGIFPRHP